MDDKLFKEVREISEQLENKINGVDVVEENITEKEYREKKSFPRYDFNSHVIDVVNRVKNIINDTENNNESTLYAPFTSFRVEKVLCAVIDSLSTMYPFLEFGWDYNGYHIPQTESKCTYCGKTYVISWRLKDERD